MFGLFILLGVGVFMLRPVSFRTHVFEPVREVAYFSEELGVFSNFHKIQKAQFSAPTVVQIPETSTHTNRIVADLRVPNHPGEFPAVLLLHGATELGRKSGLIALLGYYFQTSGWVVLAPDARGFGDSEDPAEIDAAESWNPAPDIRRCIDYIYSLPQANKNMIFVIGHSMGAGHALEAAVGDPRIQNMVLIGPPRYTGGIQDSYWKRVRV